MQEMSSSRMNVPGFRTPATSLSDLIKRLRLPEYTVKSFTTYLWDSLETTPEKSVHFLPDSINEYAEAFVKFSNGRLLWSLEGDGGWTHPETIDTVIDYVAQIMTRNIEDVRKKRDKATNKRVSAKMQPIEEQDKDFQPSQTQPDIEDDFSDIGSIYHDRTATPAAPRFEKSFDTAAMHSKKGKDHRDTTIAPETSPVAKLSKATPKRAPVDKAQPKEASKLQPKEASKAPPKEASKGLPKQASKAQPKEASKPKASRVVAKGAAHSATDTSGSNITTQDMPMKSPSKQNTLSFNSRNLAQPDPEHVANGSGDNLNHVTPPAPVVTPATTRIEVQPPPRPEISQLYERRNQRKGATAPRDWPPTTPRQGLGHDADTTAEKDTPVAGRITFSPKQGPSGLPDCPSPLQDRQLPKQTLRDPQKDTLPAHAQQTKRMLSQINRNLDSLPSPPKTANATRVEVSSGLQGGISGLSNRLEHRDKTVSPRIPTATTPTQGTKRSADHLDESSLPTPQTSARSTRADIFFDAHDTPRSPVDRRVRPRLEQDSPTPAPRPEPEAAAQAADAAAPAAEAPLIQVRGKPYEPSKLAAIADVVLDYVRECENFNLGWKNIMIDPNEKNLCHTRALSFSSLHRDLESRIEALAAGSEERGGFISSYCLGK